METSEIGIIDNEVFLFNVKRKNAKLFDSHVINLY